MKKKPTYENVTLQKLLTTKIREQGLSRSDLVRLLGYTNVSKGLRRLDGYLTTLKAPSDEFIVRLHSALEINGLEFCRAVSCTLEKMSADAEKEFKPYIEVLLGIQIRPAIAWQIVHNRCRLSVPQDLQDKPYREEIDTVIALFQDHIENILHSSLKRNVIGFEYHRKHDHYLKFNADLVLEETVYVQPAQIKKLPLGNRLANLLFGGGAI